MAIARAVVGEPALLLADEPTGNLDPATAQVVLGEIVALAKQDGATVLLVTHDSEVAARADRRLELKQGRLHPG